MTLQEAKEVLEKELLHLRATKYAKDGDKYYFCTEERDPKRLELQKMRLLFGPYQFFVTQNGEVEYIPFEDWVKVFERNKDRLTKI